MSDGVLVTMFFLLIVLVFITVRVISEAVLRRWTARASPSVVAVEVPQDSPNAEMLGGPMDGMLVTLPLQAFLDPGVSVIGQEHREDGMVVCHGYKLEPACQLPNGMAPCRYLGVMSRELMKRSNDEDR